MTAPTRRLGLLALVAAAGVLATVTGLAQQPNFDDVEVQAFHVQESVYMLVGAGGNVTVQVGDDGVLVVDTQFAEMADKLLATIDDLSGGAPLRYVVNTHVHGDHVGGNARFRAAGNAVVAGNVAFEIGGNAGALILAHENVQLRMAQPGPGEIAAPSAALPTDTFFDAQDEVYFNGEAVELLHQAAAHTDGDVLVYFRRSDVVSAGDLYNTTGYPFIDMARGGTIEGIVDGLNAIIQITIPRDKQEGGTMVIPGHGRLSDEADVVEYRDMVTIIRDRVRAMVEAGLSLDEVLAAAPTSDYDGRYGRDEREPARFVEAVYRTLGGQ